MRQAIKTGLCVIGVTGNLFVFGIFFSNAEEASSSEKLEIKLDNLNKKLLNFRNFLSSTKASASEAEKLLRSSEKELNTLVNAIGKKKNSIKKNKSKVLNLGSEKGTSVLEILSLLEKSKNTKIKKKFLKKRKGDLPKLISSSKLANKILGWKAKIGKKDIIDSAYNWHYKFLNKK